MKSEFVEILSCPRCEYRMALAGSTNAVGDIGAGQLECPNGHVFPIVRGVPRFVNSELYAGSFGFEWNAHKTTQLDNTGSSESEDTFTLKTGFSPEQLSNKRVLDVGCGMGRFADVASRWGATVVGVDLSSAVDAAWSNIGYRSNVHIAQADVFDLPFAEGTFDFIFSIGVLHHTPNTKRAFDRLPRLLRPGGTIAIWLYSTKLRTWCWSSDILRHVTTRLPKRVLYGMCHLAVPAYYLYRLPLIGRLPRLFFPISMHPKARWRVLDTFDWYAPRYQWKHSADEVVAWCQGQDLDGIHILAVPTSLQATRPE